MTSDSSQTRSTSRRDFLAGRALQLRLEEIGERLADQIVEGDEDAPSAPPAGGDTIRLETRAMACEFAVILNPGPSERILAASAALDLVHELEDQLTVYREHSEMSRLNARATGEPVVVERKLFDLLQRAVRLCEDTGGAFDPTSGPLIALWRACRQEARVPSDEEIAASLARTGIEHVEFDETAGSVCYRRSGVELNLGGIGKGYALDRAGELLVERGIGEWLLHGGQSSILARGDHNRTGGWPVGLVNPLFPEQRFATVLLRDRALSTSGSGVQHFRLGGERYGHILDPRSGRPTEQLLSATVLAPTAAEADALSTAFFVMGVENARRYCDNYPDIGAILIPRPDRGKTLDPVVVGVPRNVLFLA